MNKVKHIFKIAKYLSLMYFHSQCKHIRQPFFVYEERGSDSWPIVVFRLSNVICGHMPQFIEEGIMAVPYVLI